MKERKIGEIFEHNGEWYQCVEHKGCLGCAFALSHGLGLECGFNGDPHCVYKSDGKHVIFKKLEKVGEPYTTFEDKTLQNYLLETGVTVPPKDVIVLINNEQRLIAIEIGQTKEDMEEKKLNLKPFDIQKAREGRPVCTRDGRKARIICFDAKGKQPIIALFEREKADEVIIQTYNDDGSYYGLEKEDNRDLMMLPEKRTGWINIHQYDVYKTKEEAEAKVFDKANYLTTIEIEY